MPSAKIFAATVFGGSLEVAEELMPCLEQAGYQVTVYDEPQLSDLTDQLPDLAVFCVSSTGSGDFPPNFADFAHTLDATGAPIAGLKYGLIALGDSSYPTYCGAGRRLDELLTEYGAQRVGERLEIDATEVLQPYQEALDWAEEWVKLL
ncbi:flavodoxin domain-containing protein [Carnimonas bestiolae]|uniref:flavodoxin domain-containing protein n=1 Tax=Carnimonas bestiolae TaxID=3402172 RepID=UPI003EDB8C51